ncbi:class I SAM-dependent methyltransferase [Leclercia sp.]|uniref:class I SAM-dependent methyltransferase n=1 Tax=Leclercia sp. TaxID=1898428 RepID=UPI0028BEF4BA|nr:class I SAM-dependent methyltransferase [Leclercia sp.]
MNTIDQWRAVEQAEYERAQKVSPYHDDAAIAAITQHITAQGHRLFQLFRSDADDAEHVANLLDVFRLPIGARVLDLACGVGAMSELIHQQLPDLDITLQNISESQLALCSDRFKKIHCDFHAVPAPDASFDAVILCYALGHSRLHELTQEISRLVRPGGVAAFFDIFTTTYVPDLTDQIGYVAYSPVRLVEEMELAGFRMTDSRDEYYPDQALEGFMLPEKILDSITPFAMRFVKNQRLAGLAPAGETCDR